MSKFFNLKMNFVTIFNENMFGVIKRNFKCNCGNLTKFYSTKTQKIVPETKNIWKPVIGLEVHAQISSNTKLFSGAKSEFAALVNDCVAPFDASIPGTLPVLNRRCVEAGVLTGLALSCKINPVSTFDRKHYFYADLPTGYQITQQRAPIAQDGEISFLVYTPGIHKRPYTKISKIKQIQLEQDSGKSLHEVSQNSLIDLNRAGCPLIEVVFEPDLEDGEEAAALVKELIQILTKIKCCSGRMEEGALRVDANISVHRQNEPLGTRTEIKNIFSVRAVANAIKYEIDRQISLLNNDEIIINETRSWNAEDKVTVPMRDKEVKQDYRYMPEPNLPPLRLSFCEQDKSDLVNVPSLEKQLPELPKQIREKLITQYNLPLENVVQLCSHDILLEYFLEICDSGKRKSAYVAHILTTELLGMLNKLEIPLENCPISLEQIGQLIDLKDSGEINTMILRKVLEVLVKGTKDTPESIVDSNNWRLINDPEVIEKFCKEVIANNPVFVEKYRKGKKKFFNALASALAKATNEKANMAIAVAKLEELIKK